jgi:hypothetical protein
MNGAKCARRMWRKIIMLEYTKCLCVFQSDIDLNRWSYPIAESNRIAWSKNALPLNLCLQFFQVFSTLSHRSTVSNQKMENSQRTIAT